MVVMMWLPACGTRGVAGIGAIESAAWLLIADADVVVLMVLFRFCRT